MPWGSPEPEVFPILPCECVALSCFPSQNLGAHSLWNRDWFLFCQGIRENLSTVHETPIPTWKTCSINNTTVILNITVYGFSGFSHYFLFLEHLSPQKLGNRHVGVDLRGLRENFKLREAKPCICFLLSFGKGPLVPQEPSLRTVTQQKGKGVANKPGMCATGSDDTTETKKFRIY